MTEEPDNLTLRYLRRLDEKSEWLGDQLSDLVTDVRSIKTHMAGLMQNEIAQDGVLASMKEGLSRIETRLDLREDHP